VKTLTYKSGSYEEAASFKELNKFLEEIESNYKSKDQGCNRFSYLAIPPNVVSPVAKNIKDECYLTTEDSLNRIIVQNWFGTDLRSCRDLTTSLHKSWSEQEIFRIDYYLGKAMVKNITCIRFANFRMEGDYVWLEGAWNRDSISNILISWKEPFGTEGRGGYFDKVGIIRDVMQNRKFNINFSRGGGEL
jgi:glucose-6-phosphate 1-dehydrogenase